MQDLILAVKENEEIIARKEAELHKLVEELKAMQPHCAADADKPQGEDAGRWL